MACQPADRPFLRGPEVLVIQRDRRRCLLVTYGEGRNDLYSSASMASNPAATDYELELLFAGRGGKTSG